MKRLGSAEDVEKALIGEFSETKSDCISRQAAYDTLSVYYHHRTDIQHMALKEALNLVPSAQQWTPCSERLPEEKSDWKSVTVLDESGDTAFTYTSVGFYLSDGMWIVDNEPMEDGNLIRVVAWMPLPEPYKGGQE